MVAIFNCGVSAYLATGGNMLTRKFAALVRTGWAALRRAGLDAPGTKRWPHTRELLPVLP